MKEILHPKVAVAPQAVEEPPTFRDELRAILFPEKRWHYLFHLLVILVTLSYWAGSLLKFPEASWGEIIMYRPSGDNQVWPTVTALSKLNFGDPTDALNYGRGVGGFHAVILFPYAAAYALCGGAGYMLADTVLSWCYLVVAALFLRRCHLGKLTSLVVASALAAGSLQALSLKLSTVVTKLLAITGIFTGEWQFPPLFNLAIFDKRIPRPMVTDIFLLLALYFLVRQWQERRQPSLKWGLAVGASMTLVAQGDPYAFAVTGLLLAGVLLATLAENRWKFPWHCALGGVIGTVVCGWYFVFQLLSQSAESAVRFGLVNYGRSTIWFLPGYGPVVRVAVVGLLALLVVLATRVLGGPAEVPSRGKDYPPHRADGPPSGLGPIARLLSAPSASVALFCFLMAIAAWFAQPIQIMLLGKGAEIYHYLLYTLPGFYAYAVLILLALLIQLAFPQALEKLKNEFSQPLNWATASLLALALFLQFSLGVEKSLEAIMATSTSREEFSPWVSLGDRYRRNFRALDQEFRKNPALRETRTFATFCHEANFLLTAFHGKRAYLPDNAYTTLSDEQLEGRLFEVGKICGMSADIFGQFIQNSIVMNYWLGCAKYWFAPDHTFSPTNDYLPNQLEDLKRMKMENPFTLLLPQSELQRLVAKYIPVLSKPPDLKSYPDVVIMTVLLTGEGVYPRPPWYREVYTNDVFRVYAKPLGTNSSMLGGLTNHFQSAQP